VHPSPFGFCLVAATDKGICSLSFLSGLRHREAVIHLRKQWRRATFIEDRSTTKAVVYRIFDPSRRAGDPPLNVIMKGTNFQVRVWEALVRIPPGFVASYEDVAARVGAPAAVRAVGNAVSRNPVAFLVPCHRVIRKTGAFGGYRGGAARKKAMLAWEASRFRGRDEGPGA
jgi:AraC family transcriptional regulator of adaptative response/methylated-DNA-[protein]-cysteine methyltransferase